MQQLISRTSLHGYGTIHPRLRGFGAITANQGVAIGTSTATVAVTATLAPTIAAALGFTVAATIPIIGAAIALIGFGIEAIINSGCGQPCVVTTQWANQAEAALQQNIAAYFAIPAPRPLSVQQAAMANYTAIWNSLVQQCSATSLGAPGQRCISDRQEGSCVWKQTAAALPPWGTPAVGACWNWYNGYFEPIATDPNVTDDGGVATVTAAASSVSTDVASAGSQISTALGLPSTTSSYLVPGLIAAGILLLVVGGGD